MSIDWQRDTIDFHKKCHGPIGLTPHILAPERRALRINLIDEEFQELQDAWIAGDIAEVADALGDLIYVTIGAANESGIDLRGVWDAIHASNMEKDGNNRSAMGKVLKPPGWTHPDIAGVLAKQGPLLPF